MTRAVTIALTVALLAPAPAHAVLLEGVPWFPVTLKPTHVTVARGDTLAELFADTPGGWTRAAYVNDLDDPDLIRPGQRLRIPLKDGKRWVPPRPAPTVSRSYAPSTRGLNWSALAACESGGNPRAVSASGTYRGAFQFDLATWHSVGMTGDPINHSYGTQLAAAQRLYASRGRSPWPHCGALL